MPKRTRIAPSAASMRSASASPSWSKPCEMQDAMHHEVSGVVQDGFFLRRSFAHDRLIGQCHVTKENRLAIAASSVHCSRRGKRQHVCRGVLSPEGLVKRAHLSVGKQRNADAWLSGESCTARRVSAARFGIRSSQTVTDAQRSSSIDNIRARSGGLALAAEASFLRRRRRLNSCVHTAWYHNNLNLALCFVCFNNAAHKRMANDIRAREGDMRDPFDICKNATAHRRGPTTAPSASPPATGRR